MEEHFREAWTWNSVWETFCLAIAIHSNALALVCVVSPAVMVQSWCMMTWILTQDNPKHALTSCETWFFSIDLGLFHHFWPDSYENDRTTMESDSMRGKPHFRRMPAEFHINSAFLMGGWTYYVDKTWRICLFEVLSCLKKLKSEFLVVHFFPEDNI